MTSKLFSHWRKLYEGVGSAVDLKIFKKEAYLSATFHASTLRVHIINCCSVRKTNTLKDIRRGISRIVQVVEQEISSMGSNPCPILWGFEKMHTQPIVWSWMCAEQNGSESIKRTRRQKNFYLNQIWNGSWNHGEGPTKII